MAVTFPDSPILNQSYQAENGLTYIWDGEKWSSQSAYNVTSGNFIQKDGGNTVVYADTLGMGIGTTSPSAELEVVGDIRVSGLNRGIGDKLGDFVSVKDYGAVGDGVTDDTAAIQAALDAVGAQNNGGTTGGVVYMPEGIYQITSTLVIQYKNVSLIGSGKVSTYIRRDQFAADTLLVKETTFGGVNNVVVEGLTMLDNASDPYFDDKANTPMTGAHLVLFGIQTCRVSEVDATNGANGIRIYGGADIALENVTVLGKYDLGQRAWNGDVGIALYDDPLASPRLATQVKGNGVRVGTSGGRIKGWKTGLLIKGAEQVGFVNSYFGNCAEHNVHILQDSAMDVQILEITFGNGCYIDGAGSHAVRISGATASGNNYIGNVRFTGADIKGQSGDSFNGIQVDTGLRAGAYPEALRGLSIDGCTISGHNTHGVFLGAVVDYIISDCHIVGNNYWGGTFPGGTGSSNQNGNGIVVSSAASNGIITDNFIGKDSEHRSPGDPGYTGQQIYGVQVLSGAGSTKLSNNELVGNVTGRLDNQSAQSVEDSVSVKDFGAMGDGITDDTAAIAAAIAASKVVTFPPGVYNTDPILIKDTRSRSLIAEGSFDPVQQPVVLRPRQDQAAIGTFFEIGSSAYIKIQGIAFVSASKVTDTLVHLRVNSDIAGSAAGTLRVKFEECSFLVGDNSSLQPTKTVRLSNAGQTDFVRCFFEGGSATEYGVGASVAVELGDTTSTNPGTGGTPYGDGGASQTVFQCCYFKGDVARPNADHTHWFNCNFYAKPFESNTIARIFAPSTSILTAMEKIDNCYLDTFNTTIYFGSWYTQSSVGGVEISNSLLAGYNSLIEINEGNCKIFANRFLSLGGSGGRRCVYLASGAGAKAEIFGNDTTQIESSNSISSIPVRFIQDDRPSDTYDHYEILQGSDHTITTTASDIFTYSYKSIGTYITVRAQLALKHGSSSARRYEFKVQYDGATVSPKRAITLVDLNEIHTHFIEQTFYLPAAGEAKDLAISVTTTAETGSILKDDSWWAVEKVYT